MVVSLQWLLETKREKVYQVDHRAPWRGARRVDTEVKSISFYEIKTVTWR